MDETVRKRHIREPPSVPFIWEAKPGIPKKDWKPEVTSLDHLPITPLKLIASVPFVWEEKPGKPLPNFSHVSRDSVKIHVASSSSSDNVNQHGSDIDDSESITSLDLEAFSFDTNESSLLANCLVSSAKISNAIPLQKNSLSKHNYEQLYTPSSPPSSEEDSDSSISSYATGRSPTGSAILECLFPLYPPKSGGFLDPSENVSSSQLEPIARDFNYDDHTCDMFKKPPTLGELIMMSRRRSCIRKAAQMNKWDPPKVILIH